MRKIYQLKKTSYWFWDDDAEMKEFLENDELSEEFYSTHKKAFNALVNQLKRFKGEIGNPYKDINLFPREHFIIEKHKVIENKNWTCRTKWELIEIEPW